MSCLIVSDQIRVQMNNRDMAIAAEDVATNPLAERSALQRPDMSRMRLSAILRRNRRPTQEAPRLSWSAMLNRRIADCANSNAA